MIMIMTTTDDDEDYQIDQIDHDINQEASQMQGIEGHTSNDDDIHNVIFGEMIKMMMMVTMTMMSLLCFSINHCKEAQ